MNIKTTSLVIIFAFLLVSCGNSQSEEVANNDTKIDNIEVIDTAISVGAEQIDEYLPLLENKSVALLVNHSSLVNQTHLVDTLLSLEIDIKRIFAPEHGFRGNKERGENFNNDIDEKTGLPIISLIGSKKRPSQEDLADVDVVIYDIQDVGVRFFTYISSMFELMQACAEYNKALLILDRPNPNGDYVDGPVLDTVNFRSFVGMLPIPVVYGMTHAELAQMINGEGWLTGHRKCDITIVKVKNYNHQKHYSLPVKPSPNLPNDLSIRLYPSLCFFEATKFSVGRGTEFPFQVLGYPDKRFGDFTFTPQDIVNVQTNPIQEGELCYGIDLRNVSMEQQFTLKYVIDYFQLCGNDISLITNVNWFNLLMGNAEVQKQIHLGYSEQQIRELWEPELSDFKEKRKKYLLYDE
ncbi:MAG: DUF1343 domain-containing protein [Bacteroidales bacterium]|nr:DUF1343 domain-containing protein [Bacteroidales bacterium]